MKKNQKQAKSVPVILFGIFLGFLTLNNLHNRRPELYARYRLKQKQ